MANESDYCANIGARLANIANLAPIFVEIYCADIG